MLIAQNARVNPPLYQHVTISPDVLISELDDEIVLLDVKSEHYFTLDFVGASLWHHLARNADVEAAIALLLAEYDVDEATLRRDVEVMLGQMLRAGLLIVAETT